MFVKLMFFAIEIHLCGCTHAHIEKGMRGKRDEREINPRQHQCISINPLVYSFTLFMLVSELYGPALFAHMLCVLADILVLRR